MKKLQFKLIPFVISLLIVVGTVGGICAYSYYKYDNNKLRFVSDYFNYEDHSKVTSEEQIESFVKMESQYYQNVQEGLKFYDSKSKKEYTEKESSTSSNFIQGATFKDGVLHLPGYFDLKVYAQTAWNEEQEEWVFSYYFYLYNVNYQTKNIINNLYLVFVDGIGEAGEGELFGTTKLDTIIQEVKDGENGSANTINQPSYKYNGKTASSYSMYLYDNGATNYGDIDTTPYIYRLTSLNETHSESSDLDDEYGNTRRWFYELNELTFSIFYSGNNDLTAEGEKEDLQEIVRGTYTKQFKDAEEFNKTVGSKGIFEGYNKDLYKAGFFKFIFWRIFIQGLVAFVISGVLAFLFYLIWQDDEETIKKNQVNFKKLKPKK